MKYKKLIIIASFDQTNTRGRVATFINKITIYLEKRDGNNVF